MGDIKTYRDSSNRLCFDLFRIPAVDYPNTCKLITDAFSLSPAVPSFGAGLDAVFMDFRDASRTVEFAWDNWSGFIVTAKDSGSESLVLEIAEWFRAH